MSALLLTKLKTRIQAMTLIPDRGGCFELTVDGKLLYSKLETGTFPEETAILQQVSQQG